MTKVLSQDLINNFFDEQSKNDKKKIKKANQNNIKNSRNSKRRAL